MLLNKAYYTLKRIIPRPLQIRLRRYLIQRKRSLHAEVWAKSKAALAERL